MAPDEQPQDPHAQAAEEMRELEQADEVPKDPTDWPGGEAKYVTYGGESDEPYGEGPTSKLGPAEVAHHDDGSISIGGEKVDDPSRFKGEPITSGVIEQIERSRQVGSQGAAEGASEDGEGDGGR